jgi:hypothetical protein
MKGMQHPALVQMLGVCTRERPLFIIVEFLSRGCPFRLIRFSVLWLDIGPGAVRWLVVGRPAAGLTEKNGTLIRLPIKGRWSLR